MRNQPSALTVTALKDEARTYRASQAQSGQTLTHSQALEAVARANGFRDWNTAAGLLPVALPPAYAIGERVSGRYLKQPFEGTIMGVAKLGAGDRFQLTIKFDAPVDVVAFDSFSALRQRVVAIVGPEGRSASRTSDGAPHMELNLKR